MNVSGLQVPFCSSNVSSAVNLYPTWQCESAVGYLAVYRICFALSVFFFLMALIMIGVKTSKDARAGIQNGSVLNIFGLHTFPCYWTVGIYSVLN
jgi:hypothetical protein